jgi:hypothetical protein
LKRCSRSIKDQEKQVNKVAISPLPLEDRRKCENNCASKLPCKAHYKYSREREKHLPKKTFCSAQ